MRLRLAVPNFEPGDAAQLGRILCGLTRAPDAFQTMSRVVGIPLATAGDRVYTISKVTPTGFDFTADDSPGSRTRSRSSSSNPGKGEVLPRRGGGGALPVPELSVRRSAYLRPVSTAVMRVPGSPDISQAMAPRRPLDLIQAVFCWIDHGSSKVHHWPLLPV